MPDSRAPCFLLVQSSLPTHPACLCKLHQTAIKHPQLKAAHQLIVNGAKAQQLEAPATQR